MPKMRMFIDSNNFQELVSNLFGQDTKLNYYLLFCGIRDYYNKKHTSCFLDKVLYFSAQADREDNPTIFDNHKAFLDVLAKIPFLTMKLGYLAKRPTTPLIPIDIADKSTYFHIEKETDVNLSNEMRESAFKKEFDVALLFAADGDYADTIIRAKQYLKDILLVLPEGAKASKLINTVGEGKVMYLTKDFLSQYIFVPKEEEEPA